MFIDELTEDSLKPLRVCRVCGKEAWTELELSLFMKEYNSQYKRLNKCMECNAREAREKRAVSLEYKEKQNKHCKDNYAKNKEVRNEKNREYHHLNKDKQNQKRREYNQTHKEEIKLKRSLPEYLGKARFLASERRRLTKIVYNKLSDKDKQVIEKLYIQASILSSLTKTKWVVDHIIPLKSPFVCGFHIPDNLQILQDKDNLKKCNYLGYLGQYNLSMFHTLFNKKPKREEIFNKLGISMTYTEFLEYEKKHFKEYL